MAVLSSLPWASSGLCGVSALSPHFIWVWALLLRLVHVWLLLVAVMNEWSPKSRFACLVPVALLPVFALQCVFWCLWFLLAFCMARVALTHDPETDKCYLFPGPPSFPLWAAFAWVGDLIPLFMLT